MPKVENNKEACKICGNVEPIAHEHHTIPQARGGKNSLTVLLCATCHNILHAHALHIISNIRNPKKSNKVFWKTKELEERARPLIQLLVQSFLEPETDSNGRYIITVETSVSIRNLLKQLKSDIEGCNSIASVVLYCIHKVATERGFSNATKQKDWWC